MGGDVTAVQVLGAGAALTVAAGVALILTTLMGWDPAPRVRAARPRPGWASLRWAVAGAAGCATAATTGWVALGAGVAASVIGLPAMTRADTRAATQIDRVEAVEEWTRRLADVLAIGVGLEQAIQTAARTAPEPIADEVTTLSARLAARNSTESALRRFADDLDDPTADLVVAALILASRRRGPGVSAALAAIAESVAEEVAARRRIEADRAKPRATARAVTMITVGIVGMGLINRGYTAPYGTSVGQVVLAATFGFFGAALWWMHSMTRTTRPVRMLAAAEVSR
jgi:Flp pilus assembly protein TadB